MAKKFKVIEKKANEDIPWEGEELQAQSTTPLEADKGQGIEVILRFFDFAADPKVFAEHKPTAQELFDSHRNGITAMLWADGLSPLQEIEPRLILSKDHKIYRFVVSCVPSLGNTVVDKPRTLSELVSSK